MAVRVLIVDDLSFMRDAIRGVVESAGFIVVGEAEDGAMGVDMYRKVRPDVVLLDITMPVMDGLSALRRIRSSDPGATVIMCSSMGQQTYIIKAIQSGARDFIVKPFRPERIVSAISKATSVYGKAGA